MAASGSWRIGTLIPDSWSQRVQVSSAKILNPKSLLMLHHLYVNSFLTRNSDNLTRLHLYECVCEFEVSNSEF